MIKGIGMDIVELGRIKKIMEKQPRFIERILTETERIPLSGFTSDRKVEYVAGRFSAKEAFAKALGTGIGKELSFLDLEIKKDSNGKPYIYCRLLNEDAVHLTITHSKDYAAATVIIESLSC